MWKVNLKIFVAFCVFMTALTGPAAEGKLITVDDNAPANFTSIQPAINYASNGDFIEVRPGRYYEAINFNGKAVRLYSSGGPAVTTIDATGLSSSAVTCNSGEDANTILEGFTITGGSGTTVSGYKYGGGMYNLNSSPTVKDCNFTTNSVTGDGGGMYNRNSSPTVTNCSFAGNHAAYAGGGMDNRNNSSPTVADCTFSQNTAGTNGGGIENWNGSNPTVTNCTFSGNSATDYGGGMYNYDYSSPTLTNCNFSENEAYRGGGMFNNKDSSPTMTDCTFSGNSAGWNGGGMYNITNSSPTVTNCTFTGNTASSNTYGGGGIFNHTSSNPAVTNCTFTGNTATTNGGGMYNYNTSSPTLTNCTFNGNSASSGFGGGMYNSDSSPTVTNCILWGDSPDEIVDYNSTTSVLFSDVQGVVWPGPVNISADPLFLDAAGGDLRLSSDASPCIDHGYNAPYLPPTDLSGNPRIVDGDRNGTAMVDMGAYEFQSWLIHNITGDIWYETIQAAIDDAANADEIEVSPGIYNEAIDFKGKAIRLYSSGGPEVTTIDANGVSDANHVVKCVSGEDANTILEGFTITGGNATGSFPDDRGGGMYNSQSSPTVTNCTFSGNTAGYTGGGMYNSQSSPTVTNCTFSSNTAHSGGGMGSYSGSPTVTNCTFTGNTATTYGGGMGNFYGSPTVTNCKFTANKATVNAGGMCNWIDSSPTVTNCTFSGNSANYGGGMYNYTSSNPTVTNCTFTGNTAYSNTYGGGGMYNLNSSPTVTNCTFSGNWAGTEGGGMYNINSSPTVTNCILWCDTPNEIYDYGNNSSNITYSDVEGGWPDANNTNIDADPCFVDANNADPNVWNLRLQPDSLCIDAGNTTAVPAGILVDVDGNPRGLDDPASPDTGTSFLGVTVDMGVYEFQPCLIAGDINCDGVVDFKDLAILCNNWLAGAEPEL